MSQPHSTTRLLLLVAAITNPFCWLPCVTAAQSVLAEMKTGDLRGTVFTVEPNGDPKFVAGVQVKLSGPSLANESVTNNDGAYTFITLVPRSYLVEANAPGLIGASTVNIIVDKTIDAAIQLHVAVVKESVTVKASDEPLFLKEPQGQTVLTRSTVLNAPNKYDRFDALLPLVPGVVRGPDGFINMKGGGRHRPGHCSIARA